MDLFSQNKLNANPEQVKQIKNWVYRILEVDSRISISISQLACKEAGCPPIETAIVVMAHPAQQYKIHKSIDEINEMDICELSGL